MPDADQGSNTPVVTAVFDFSNIDLSGLSGMAAPSTSVPEPAATDPTPAPKVWHVNTPLTAADRSAEWFSLALPSNFYFYDKKELFARRVRGAQQIKFTMAAQQNDTAMSVEAVNSCLNGINARDLTVQDYFYVMYWLRQVSYTSRKYTHVSVCRNPAHLADVAARKVTPDSLRTVHVIEQTDMTERVFDPAALLALDLTLANEAGLTLRPPMVSDMIAIAELASDPSVPEYAEMVTCLDTYSGVIGAINGKPVTAQERYAFLQTAEPDLMHLLSQYTKAVTQYGVQEFINVKCAGCGASGQTELSVSAHSFF